MSNLKIIFTLGFFFLLGCSEGSGTAAKPAVAQPLAERPSAAEIISSRPLLLQEDSRISYCEVLSADKKSYSGFRDQALYPLASLSKVITTAWVLKKLGPDFKFESTWYLKSVSATEGIFDAYLKTNYDPVFNIDKALYSLSLLRQQGVLKIRNLVIDETTHVYLSSLAQPHLELETVPISSNETLQNLELILNSKNWGPQTIAATEKLKAWSTAQNKYFQLPAAFSVEQIIFKNSQDIDVSLYSKKISLQSSAVLKYLKNLNVFSNNYIADALFAYLGGRSEFEKFQSSELQLTPQQLKFNTGSGLAGFVSGQRQDNLGSCFSMLKVFSYLDLQAKSTGLNLGHFLYNPAQDHEGTFESKLVLSNQVVLKTGRLFENPAFNLAGIIATRNGPLFFAFLGHDFLDTEADEIQKARDLILASALNYYPTVNEFLTLDDFQNLL